MFSFNTCSNDLIQELDVYVEHMDGGIMIWVKLTKMLQGQATLKMLALQETIKDTK